MFNRYTSSRTMLALVGALGVFASGFATTNHVASAAPTVIFSENFNSTNMGTTGAQAHTGLTVGYLHLCVDYV